ncbi:hypothetical protein [Pseudonocardia abyssalis]|uniref:Uncharacterized protein n=1 Tax=Pseudonocardia abyssalis TaxID=2792008 RepID=A0ABS6UYZ1_9PSEU|nr:hypothetical protein [Pseudonocardia abyssalis]MBW0114931.1 hypothetical protein [Pseudonocardia abyssalis]MBW0136934.1 hypothetical protein [Pseudonocardia abyssalis]
MPNSTRTIICFVCDTAFAYAYTGGRDRRTCDKPACKRARKTGNKRTERSAKTTRPDGYRPADYPHKIPSALPDDQLAVLVETTKHHYMRRKLRVQPDCVSDADGGSVDPDHDVDNRPEAQLYEAGHGLIMDDYRDRDSAPVRLIEPKYRDLVKHWFKQAGFPLAGLRLDVTRGQYPVTRVRGRHDEDAFDGLVVPRRLARHACTRTAVSPLDPFVSLFPCISEGQMAA